MPRLLSVNNYHYRRGGSDVVYLDHAALIEQHGWDNSFFSMRHPKNLDTPWSKYFINEIEFGHAYSTVQRVAMASKVIYSFEAQKKLRRLLNDFPTDVAHLHCIYHHLSPAILPVFRDFDIPVVMTAHDLKIACPAYKMLNAGGICEKCKGGDLTNLLRNRCVRNSLSASAVVMVETAVHRFLNTYKSGIDKIVVPSKFFLEKFVEWGWPRERFRYIPNYVNSSDFEARFQPGEYFLYFGRLAPEKGVATLMHAASIANVNLKIVGTGPIESELHALQKQLQGQVEFLGYRSGDKLRSLIQGARAVVLPSEWYENAPMSILESFASGKPVIGANIGGIPEMVIEDETGWTFQSGSIDDLCSLLLRVSNLPSSVICQIGRNAKNFVETNFSKTGYLEATLSMYAELGVKK